MPSDGCPPSLSESEWWPLPFPDRYSPTHRFYSDIDIDHIIAATGFPLPTTVRYYGMFSRSPSGITCVQKDKKPIKLEGRHALAIYMEQLARCYDEFRQLNDIPSTLECRNGYAQIANACQGLLDAIHEFSGIFDIDVMTGGTPEAPSVFIVENDVARPPRPDFQRSVVEVQNLLNWASWCRDGLGKNLSKNRHGGARKTQNRSFDRWICYLTAVFVWVFDKSPGLTRNSKPGPFLRYLDACVRPVLRDETPTAEGFRSRFLKLRKGGLIKR